MATTSYKAVGDSELTSAHSRSSARGQHCSLQVDKGCVKKIGDNHGCKRSQEEPGAIQC